MEIAAKIIEIAQSGVVKTKILYGATLSFSQLKDYLEFLQENGLLEYISEKKLYRTTEKGMHFLYGYEELQHMLYPKEREVLKKPKAWLLWGSMLLQPIGVVWSSHESNTWGGAVLNDLCVRMLFCLTVLCFDLTRII